MNRSQACRILGVLPDISVYELKKRYHILMVVTHPDSVSEHDYPYEVHEINDAYGYLLEHLTGEGILEKEREAQRIRWDAPINPNAYTERPIYQYYEDESGNRLGIITVDFGKYMWSMYEDFPLFLKSLYSAAKQIISEDDEKKHLDRTDDMSLMADITYLIAGQFFGSDMALGLMKWDADSESYFTKAMLELNAGAKLPDEGTNLIPGSVKDHRLFVCDARGVELGYLSFKDDRLLFGLIPLFERREVQVRMKIRKYDKKAKSADVDLWVRSVKGDNTAVESINLKIQKLLEGYRELNA